MRDIEPIPFVDDYSSELQEAVHRSRAHLVCMECNPEPEAGTVALCGYAIKGELPKPSTLPCVRCHKLTRIHDLKHRKVWKDETQPGS